ncbi:hypothetical protein U9745_01145 [Escherichia coli]
MTKYATNNPLGSMDPKDLFDNAQNLDFALNDITQAIWLDRFGRGRQTFWGMEQRFNQFIANSGYDVIGEYTAGPLTIREYNQLIRYNNELWKLKATTDVPFTTTGNNSASWVNDSVHFVSVGDAALRQELAAPGGAGLVGGLLKPITWSGFAGGADPTGVNSSTAAFQASLDQVGYINIQPGEYLIDGSLNITKAAVIFGAGRGISKVKFSGNASTPLLKILLGHASQSVVCLRDVTFNAAIPNCGPLVSISTDAASQAASQVVVGDTDKLIIDNVDAYGDSTAGNYWNCGVEAIDCGGLSINGFTLNNKTTSAQTNTTTAGFRLKTTDPKVSVIRAITANNFYILRANYGLETAPISNTKGGITSYYLSDFEIVGVKNGIKAQNWCAAWRVTGHIDSTEQCLNFQGAALTNARFADCDFRKGNNGGLGYVAGPMVTLDYGEQITFAGSTFSGINLNLADPSNVAFSFTNVYNRSYTFLMSVLGNTFTKFQNVLGQTNGASNIVIGPNAYNQIADAITFDSNLDSSFNLHTPVSSLSKTVALPVGDSSFTVDLVANRFKSAPNYADARPVNNTAQAVRVVYDYAASTASLLTFRVYGVTTAATFRFGITTA